MKRTELLALSVFLGILSGLLIDTAQRTMGAPLVYVAEAEEIAPREVLIEVKIDWTKERIRKEVDDVAQKYGVSADDMWRTIQCESMGSTTIQSHWRRPDGSREQSYGLAQIYLPAHPHVTKEQAQDPQFAIDFMAKHFAQGRQGMWSCWK
jgi:hypothetical protein